MPANETRRARFEDGDEFLSAATIYKGTLYFGNVHLMLANAIQDEHPDMVRSDCVEGFVTKKGRFLTRVEAKSIADQLGIVRNGRDKAIDRQLWSEYLPVWVLAHSAHGAKNISKTALQL